MIVTDFGEDDQPPALPSSRTLERFILSAAAAIPLRGEISVLLTDDRKIRKLNRDFRRKNKPTDVLSFPAANGAGPRSQRVAGDLAISVDMASRQALVLDHSLSTELKVLILHGMLHLAGFDHETDKGEMADRELGLRQKLRLPGGLIERTESNGLFSRQAVASRQTVAKKSASKKKVVSTASKRVAKKASRS